LEHELVARDNPPRLVSELVEPCQRIWTATGREMSAPEREELTEFIGQIQNPDAKGWIAEVTEAMTHIVLRKHSTHKIKQDHALCTNSHISF
jgi:hypothetical protein